jgi:nucleoside-diphosphate-sugar epimerase
MVLVTGASGFVGGELVRYLSGKYSVRAVARTFSAVDDDVFEKMPGFDLSEQTDWSQALQGIDVVVHCAARVHIMNEVALDPLEEFRRVNVRGALRLAQQAADSGVKRFIYLSSIKVNGESTKIGMPFTPQDKPSPKDAYGASKWEAECALMDLGSKTNMEVVIIRPPLIYGAGVKANFASLIRLVQLRIPLPFGLANNNLRSFVALGNLLSFIEKCIQHPRAANQTFLISDNEDVSTATLLKKIARANNRKIYLIPFPIMLFRKFLSAIGRGGIADRLFGNLQVDISKSRSLLGWEPPLSVDEGLQKTIQNNGL